MFVFAHLQTLAPLVANWEGSIRFKEALFQKVFQCASFSIREQGGWLLCSEYAQPHGITLEERSDSIVREAEECEGR